MYTLFHSLSKNNLISGFILCSWNKARPSEGLLISPKTLGGSAPSLPHNIPSQHQMYSIPLTTSFQCHTAESQGD